MKAFLKILLFLLLFFLGAMILFGLLGFIMKIVVWVGILGILGGLLYLFFGPAEPEAAKLRQPEKLTAPSLGDVQAELKRRKKEMQ